MGSPKWNVSLLGVRGKARPNWSQGGSQDNKQAEDEEQTYDLQGKVLAKVGQAGD